jgi:HD-like signal output (HDOD) protein
MTNVADNTLVLLKQAMAEKGDLPSVSAALARMASSARDSDDFEERMTATVLSDVALTQKVLRLANSAMYASFGGTVSSVSMALYVLGSETVCHLALGLKIIDNLGKAADTDRAKEELSKAVLAGTVARSVGCSVSAKDGEALSVAALLRSLGKLLVCFYLPKEFEAIEARTPDLDNEDELAATVLGLSYASLAQHVVEGWGFPPELARNVRDQTPDPGSHANWVHSVAAYSRRHVAAVANDADDDTLHALATRFADTIGVTPESLMNLATNALLSAQEDEVQSAAVAGLKTSTALRKPKAVTINAPDAFAENVAELKRLLPSLTPAQLLSRATDTLWKGLGCAKAMLFLRKPAQASYELMLGYGDGVRELVRKIRFDDTFSPDVFHLALSNGSPVYLNNVFEPSMLKRIPTWLTSALPPAKSLFLLPFGSPKQPLGILYLDWGPDGRAQPLTPAEMGHVEQLRALVSSTFAASSASKPVPAPMAA